MSEAARRAMWVAICLWALSLAVLPASLDAAARRTPISGSLGVALSPVAPGDLPPPMADGRMLGHLPYPEASRADLIAAPPGFAIGAACLIHRDAAPDLTRMLDAATLAPGVGRSLRGVSCFRTVGHQRAVFCRNAPRGTCADPARRARFVGPPGYSEHATGYAIDFAVRPSPGCADVDSCIAYTPAGRWLLAHAPEFGFELSFPDGNPQGVTWEPWHWRWVGVTIATPGADRARMAFARARASYPASPGVADVPDASISTITTPPPATVPAAAPLPGWSAVPRR